MRRILFSMILAVLLAIAAPAECTVSHARFQVPANLLLPQFQAPYNTQSFHGIWAFVSCGNPEAAAVKITITFESLAGMWATRTQVVQLSGFGIDGMASAIFWTGPCRVKSFQVTELKEIGSQTFEVGTDIPDRSQVPFGR